MQELPSFQDDWLVVAGDVCDGWTEDRFVSAMSLLKHRFAKVFWTCGNHELYTLNSSKDEYKSLRGVAKYERMVQLCNNVGVLTPEDPYEKWQKPVHAKSAPPPSGADDVRVPEEREYAYVCPIFTLYDYSFRPHTVSRGKCLEWAQAAKVMCTDEFTLHADPYPTKDEWCAARVAQTGARLDKLMTRTDADGNAPHTILASHFSLRYDMVYSPYLPRFSLWCGTRLTEDWHQKYHADVVLYGHTHVRNTTKLDGCTFCECSLGYPNQYNITKKISDYFCQVLPEHTLSDTCTIF